MGTDRGWVSTWVHLQRVVQGGRKIQGDDRRKTKRATSTKCSFRMCINFDVCASPPPPPRIYHPNTIFTINEPTPNYLSFHVLERMDWAGAPARAIYESLNQMQRLTNPELRFQRSFLCNYENSLIFDI